VECGPVSAFVADMVSDIQMLVKPLVEFAVCLADIEVRVFK
jgi:hypothetical protein